LSLGLLQVYLLFCAIRESKPMLRTNYASDMIRHNRCEEQRLSVSGKPIRRKC